MAAPPRREIFRHAEQLRPDRIYHTGRRFQGFRIIASHSDSPSFKIKENPELETDGHYIRLNTERYGGMLCAPWFDRPLSVAGRVIVKDPADDTFRTKLVNIDRDLLLIPSLAIHMNRGGQQRL